MSEEEAGPTLVEFLMARIQDDYAEAVRLGRSDRIAEQVRSARVLADCQSKRRIVEWLGHTAENEFGWDGMDWFVLKHLASVYSDHPDYREEWRPSPRSRR